MDEGRERDSEGREQPPKATGKRAPGRSRGLPEGGFIRATGLGQEPSPGVERVVGPAQEQSLIERSLEHARQIIAAAKEEAERIRSEARAGADVRLREVEQRLARAEKLAADERARADRARGALEDLRAALDDLPRRLQVALTPLAEASSAAERALSLHQEDEDRKRK